MSRATVLRLPGGQKIRTESQKRFIVVRLQANPRILRRTDDLATARRIRDFQRAQHRPQALIFDRLTGEPVS